ncbi:MAG: hypothetical protein VB141_12860, partial [Burkholderia gladioli]
MTPLLSPPLIVNPDGLDSIPALRDALRQANRALRRQAADMHHMDESGNRLFSVLYCALRAHKLSTKSKSIVIPES